MTSMTKEIESWLRSQILVSKPQGDVVRFEVRHLPLGSKKGHEVAIIETPRQTSEEWFESVASEIAVGIQCDADALGGVQRYALIVFREKDSDKPQARKLLRIAADTPEDESDDFDSEPKNIKGTLAQLMRHNEAYAKTMSNMLAATVTAQSRQISRLAEHNEKLLEQRFETIELIENLQSERQKRELEAARALNREKLLGDIMGEVKLLGPTIVNKVAGKEILPDNNPASLAMLRLAESLQQSPERLAKIAALLNPSEQVAFGSLLQALDNKN